MAEAFYADMAGAHRPLPSDYFQRLMLSADVQYLTLTIQNHIVCVRGFTFAEEGKFSRASIGVAQINKTIIIRPLPSGPSLVLVTEPPRS